MKESFEPLNKTHASHARQINRLRKVILNHQESLLFRKLQIHQFGELIKKMINDGRISKEEVGQFILSKEKNRKILFK